MNIHEFPIMLPQMQLQSIMFVFLIFCWFLFFPHRVVIHIHISSLKRVGFFYTTPTFAKASMFVYHCLPTGMKNKRIVITLLNIEYHVETEKDSMPVKSQAAQNHPA